MLLNILLSVGGCNMPYLATAWKLEINKPKHPAICILSVSSVTSTRLDSVLILTQFI